MAAHFEEGETVPGEDEVLSVKTEDFSAQDIVDIILPHVRDLKTEVSKVVYLNSDNRIIDISDAAVGTVNQAMPIIREIIHAALQKFAAAIGVRPQYQAPT